MTNISFQDKLLYFPDNNHKTLTSLDQTQWPKLRDNTVLNIYQLNISLNNNVKPNDETDIKERIAEVLGSSKLVKYIQEQKMCEGNREQNIKNVLSSMQAMLQSIK
jgi:hypothetical protein